MKIILEIADFLTDLMLPNDILFCIGSQISAGNTWKSWVQVCKFNYHLSTTSLAHKRYEVYNQSISLLNLYPNKLWDSHLSSNSNLTWQIVQDHVRPIVFFNKRFKQGQFHRRREFNHHCQF